MGVNADYENVKNIEKGMYIFMYLHNKKCYYKITRVYNNAYNLEISFKCILLKLQLHSTEIVPKDKNTKEFNYKRTYKLVPYDQNIYPYNLSFHHIPLRFICETDPEIIEITAE